jgi:hypothetical protein
MLFRSASESSTLRIGQVLNFLRRHGKLIRYSVNVRPNKKNTWLASPPASRFSAASEFLKIFFYVNLFVLQPKTV